MPRSDFISDDLVDMRERLRRNYENFHAQQRGNGGALKTEAEPGSASFPAVATLPDDPEPSRPLSPVEDPPPAEEKKIPETPALPALHTAFDDTAFSAERRDIEGRMLRDLSRSAAEKQRRQAELEETERFRAAVESALEELRLLDEAQDLSPAERQQQFQLICSAYFRAAGSFDALECRTAGFPGAALPASPAERKTFGLLLGEQLPLILAVLLAGLSVAAAIVLVFG